MDTEGTGRGQGMERMVIRRGQGQERAWIWQGRVALHEVSMMGTVQGTVGAGH